MCFSIASFIIHTLKNRGQLTVNKYNNLPLSDVTNIYRQSSLTESEERQQEGS